MTHEQFKQQFIGQRIDYNGGFGYQSTDLVRSYIESVWEKTTQNFSGLGGAVTAFTDYPDSAIGDYAQRVFADETLEIIPKQGDIIVFGNSSKYPHGHIAIVEQAAQGNTRFISIDQNAGDGSGSGTGSDAISFKEHTFQEDQDFGHVLGWLTPMQIEPIKELEEEHFTFPVETINSDIQLDENDINESPYQSTPQPSVSTESSSFSDTLKGKQIQEITALDNTKLKEEDLALQQQQATNSQNSPEPKSQEPDNSKFVSTMEQAINNPEIWNNPYISDAIRTAIVESNDVEYLLKEIVWRTQTGVQWANRANELQAQLQQLQSFSLDLQNQLKLIKQSPNGSSENTESQLKALNEKEVEIENYKDLINDKETELKDYKNTIDKLNASLKTSINPDDHNQILSENQLLKDHIEEMMGEVEKSKNIMHKPFWLSKKWWVDFSTKIIAILILLYQSSQIQATDSWQSVVGKLGIGAIVILGIAIVSSNYIKGQSEIDKTIIQNSK